MVGEDDEEPTVRSATDFAYGYARCSGGAKRADGLNQADGCDALIGAGLRTRRVCAGEFVGADAALGADEVSSSGERIQGQRTRLVASVEQRRKFTSIHALIIYGPAHSSNDDSVRARDRTGDTESVGPSIGHDDLHDPSATGFRRS